MSLHYQFCRNWFYLPYLFWVLTFFSSSVFCLYCWFLAAANFSPVMGGEESHHWACPYILKWFFFAADFSNPKPGCELFRLFGCEIFGDCQKNLSKFDFWQESSLGLAMADWGMAKKSKAKGLFICLRAEKKAQMEEAAKKEKHRQIIELNESIRRSVFDMNAAHLSSRNAGAGAGRKGVHFKRVLASTTEGPTSQQHFFQPQSPLVDKFHFFHSHLMGACSCGLTPHLSWPVSF